METFKLLGIKLDRKTTNENGQSGKDCGELWQYFMENNIFSLIPHKNSDNIYAVYYEYESDEKGLFSYFIGCRVAGDTVKPADLDEVIIPRQTYHKITAKGPMPDCVAEAWRNIWNPPLNRRFGYDFEVYGERSRDWSKAEVDIFLSVKE